MRIKSKGKHRCRCAECKGTFGDRNAKEYLKREGCYATETERINGVWYCNLPSQYIKILWGEE